MLVNARRNLWLVTAVLCLAVAACKEDNKAKEPQGMEPGVLDAGFRDGPPPEEEEDAGKPSVQSDAGAPPEPESSAQVVTVPPKFAVAGQPYGYGPKSNETGSTAWVVSTGPDKMSVVKTSGEVSYTPDA